MKLAKRTLSFLAVTTVVLLVTETNFGRAVQGRTPVQSSTTDASDTSQDKIARAMSAGPDEIARSARIIDTDAEGNTVVLRDGGNGFTCMPGNPKVIGEPPMCVDAASLQWFADAKAHKPKPTNTIPGITYMLAGATQRSDSDPNDKTSPAITVGPHWMIMCRSIRRLQGCRLHISRLARTSCGPARRTRMCTSWDVHKTIQHVGAFNGHELWLKQVGCNREGIVFST